MVSTCVFTCEIYLVESTKLGEVQVGTPTFLMYLVPRSYSHNAKSHQYARYPDG